MREIDLPVPGQWPEDVAISWVERTAEVQGLSVRSRGTLKSYPGCVHWHLECPGESGTLEVTLWPTTRRLWLKVHSIREAAWTEAAVEVFLRSSQLKPI